MQSCRVSIFPNIRLCSPVFYENELIISDSLRESKNHCIFVAYSSVVIGTPKWGFGSDLVFFIIKWPSLFIIFVIQPNIFLMNILYAISLHRIVIMTNLVSFSFSLSILHSYHNRQYKRTDKEIGRNNYNNNNNNNNNKHFFARIYLWHGERKRTVFDWKEIWFSRQGKIKIYFIFLYVFYHSCLGNND